VGVDEFAWRRGRRFGTIIVDLARRRPLDLLPGPPARLRFPARRAALDPYLPDLERRWAEGCRNGKRLRREIRELGFAHSYSGVARFAARLRRAERAGQPAAATRRSPTRSPTPRQVALLCVQHREQRTPSQRVYLDRLRQADEAIAAAYALTQDFAAMLRERCGERLDAWPAKAEGSPVPALRRFATGLRADLEAVRAGLTEIWSNGPTAGSAHKRKLLQRQGCGRASIACGSVCSAPPEAQSSQGGKSREVLARADRAMREGDEVANGMGGTRAVG
jgi:transposase